MASAIFAVPFREHVGPDFSALGEGWLYYTEAGILKGGFSAIGHVPYPIPPNTCQVRVWAPAERIAEIAALPNYLFLEEVADVETQP